MLSPILVIIVIMMVLFVSIVLMDVNKLTILRDEIQGTADVAAAGALAYSIDAGGVYGSESMTVNESLAKIKFKKLFDDGIALYTPAKGGSLIDDHDVTSVTVRKVKAGEMPDEKNRDQYICEGLVQVQFRRTNLIDYAATTILRYRDPVSGGVMKLETGQSNTKGKIFIRGSARVFLR